MNEVNGQQDLNLEEMDEQQVYRFLSELLSNLDPQEEYNARHPEDFVMEMPQSGERIRGRENMRAFQEAYPTDPTAPPSIRLRRVLVREGLWVAEGVYDQGGEQRLVALIFELRDGKMWRDRWYFAEPFGAPEWRAYWVERIEPEEQDAVPTPGGPVASRRNELDGHEVHRLMARQWEKIRAGDLAGAHEWYDEDCVVDWPQSGERIRGRKNLLALREAYPAGVEFEVRRVVSRRDLGVSEYVIRYDGRPVNVVAIVEFWDGKVVRETHYFAEPFSPPEWRARWVELIEA